MIKKYVIGLDYGTDSVRSVIVDTGNGGIVGTAVFEYPQMEKRTLLRSIGEQIPPASS